MQAERQRRMNDGSRWSQAMPLPKFSARFRRACRPCNFRAGRIGPAAVMHADDQSIDRPASEPQVPGMPWQTVSHFHGGQPDEGDPARSETEPKKMTRVALIGRLADALERADIRLLLFLLLLLNTFSLVLVGNEDEYLAFAKAFMNANWIPGASSLRDVPGGRIIFDTVVGWILGFASFGQVAVIGRALCALLLAFPLAAIFKKVGFTNLAALCVMQFLALLGHQSFFGFEWIFGSFEAKVLCYVCVFHSFYFFLEKKHWPCVLTAGLAVYFHVLVGGWYGIVLFACLLLAGVPIRRLFSLGVVYTAIMLPMVAYLYVNYLADNPNIINGVEVSWVYVFFRNSHHLDMIGQFGRFGSTAQTGIVLSLLSFIFCFWLRRKSDDDLMRDLTLFSMVLFAQQFVSLAIAAFDHGGEFLKFYPYRTSALSLFLMLVIVIRLLERGRVGIQSTTRESMDLIPAVLSTQRRFFTNLALGLFVIALCFKTGSNLKESLATLNPSPADQARTELYEWISSHTAPDAVFMNLDKGSGQVDFMRITERESFSVYKFVPTTNRLIYDWYVRVLEAKRVKENPDYIGDLRERYRIDYLITRKPVTGLVAETVYENDIYRVFQVVD